MKHILTLVFCTILISSCSDKSSNGRKSLGFGEEDQSINSFGKEVFELIKQDTFELIQNLLQEADEYRALIELSTYSEKEKIDMKERVQDDFKDNVSSLKRSYEDFKMSASRSGIDWSKSELSYVEFKYLSINKLEEAQIVINVLFKGVVYKIKLNDCLKINNQWTIGKSIEWGGEIKESYFY